MTQFFKREDWTLFQSINTLGQKAGVPKNKILQLVAKELSDNALDTGADIITGLIEDADGRKGFYIQDNGEGIPGSDDQLVELFSINRPLISSKIIRKPSRGALGNGLRVVAGAMFALDGRIRIYTHGRGLEITPGDDGQAKVKPAPDYIPDPKLETMIREMYAQGTRIEFYAPEIPHNILTWSDQSRAINHGKNYTGKTSLYWYDSDTFFALLQAAPTGVSIRKFLSDNFDGCSGKKAGAITADFYNVEADQLDRDQVDQVLTVGRSIVGPVKHRRLGHVGKFNHHSLRGECLGYDRTESRITIYPGRGRCLATLPVIIELWAFENEKSSIFVNRTPITGQYTVAIREKYIYLDGCGLKYYHEKKFKIKPGIWINITAPYIPITSDGKAPDFSQISDEIGESLLKVLKSVNRKYRSAGPEKRSITDIVRAVVWDEVDKISRGGQNRYTLRQLFYNIRPHILNELPDKDPDYNYFCSIITNIENETGEDLPGILRDDRGVFLHPFDDNETPLGTAAVERYRRPEWQFNKVLYIEKRGLFQILKEEKIPQRYDLALMSTAGYSNRAARDLIDMIGETDEPVQFFCIHDADAAGTMIYDTLVNETKARGARTVEIIDLGLDPGEAIEMNLQVEKVSRKKSSDVGGGYKKWSAWLQNNRIELDAMPPDVFIEWIESKLNEYHDGKLVPADNYLEEYADKKLKEVLKEKVDQDVRKEFNIEKIVEERFKEQLPAIGENLYNMDLYDQIRNRLYNDPTKHWRTPADEIITDLVAE